MKQDTEVENQSINSITYRVHIHKKKTIIVKSIHLSLCSESKRKRRRKRQK